MVDRSIGVWEGADGLRRLNMKESQIRIQRLEIATKLLAGTDVVGGSTNEVTGKVTSALLVAEALIKANHESPVRVRGGLPE